MSVRPAKTQISLGIRPVWSVFAVRMKKAWVLSYPLRAQRRLWSDQADAQADLSLCWAHSHFVGFVMLGLIWLTATARSKQNKEEKNVAKGQTLKQAHAIVHTNEHIFHDKTYHQNHDLDHKS